MEGIGYFVGGFICAYLFVRSIRSIWAGGFCFLLVVNVSASWQVRFFNQHESGSSIHVQFQRQLDGVYEGTVQDLGAMAHGTTGSVISWNGSTGGIRYRVSEVGGILTGETSWLSGSDPVNDSTTTVITIYNTSGATVTFTNYVSVDCVTNTLSVPADVRYNMYVHFSSAVPGPNGETETSLSTATEQVERLQPGQVWCVTNQYLVPVDGFFVGPGSEDSNWQPATNNPAGVPGPNTSTNTLSTNILGSGSPSTAPDPFANIPGRPGISSSNANDVVQRSGEGIVRAIGDSGSLVGGKLDRMIEVLEGIEGGVGSGVTGTNTGNGVSDFGAQDGGTNAAAGYWANAGSTQYLSLQLNTYTGLVVAARAQSSLLKISLGPKLGGVGDHEINLDPNQGGLLDEFFAMLVWTKKYAAIAITIGLFLAMFHTVEEYRMSLVAILAGTSKTPDLTAEGIASRFAWGTIMMSLLTTLIGMLPFGIWGYFAIGDATPVLDAQVDIVANLGTGSSITAILKETALKYLWGVGQAIPFAELLAAMATWLAFRFYVGWLYGFVLMAFSAHGTIVLGRCILPFLFVVGSSAAQLELHNLTGTNVVWTNASRSISFPPGESRIDIEPGWYLPDGSEVSLPLTEDLQVMRFSHDASGVLVIDQAFATSSADFFWYGFSTGLSLFGLAAIVSAIKNGLCVGGRNNVWVGE